ncbi:MAG: hypothetical protein IKZ13_03170 [Akkermansia sp.]|nr:hypothetical protein [Akkermansia sp.]
MKLLKRLFLPLLLGVMGAALPVAAEPACEDKVLGELIAPADAEKFEYYFGERLRPMREQWDAAAGVRYFAYTARGKEPGSKVLHEALWMLSEDGMVLRNLTCERNMQGDTRRRNFRERVQRAAAPYVFLSADAESERIYFTYWQLEPGSRRLLDVQQKSYSYEKLKDNLLLSEIKPEHEQLLARYFSDCSAEMPARWDAEHLIRYSARQIGSYGEARYKLIARLEQVAADGSSFLFIEKELVAPAVSKIRWDAAVSSKAVYPGVFAWVMGDCTLVVLYVPMEALGVDVQPGWQLYSLDKLEPQNKVLLK